MRSSALVAALVVVLAAGCGQESSGPAAQETEPPVMTETTPSGDTTLNCANPTVMQVDHFSDARGNPDPVNAARGLLGKRIRADDVIERADTAGGKPFVRVVRGGEQVAIVRLLSADEGWLIDQVEMCPDFAR